MRAKTDVLNLYSCLISNTELQKSINKQPNHVHYIHAFVCKSKETLIEYWMHYQFHFIVGAYKIQLFYHHVTNSTCNHWSHISLFALREVKQTTRSKKINTTKKLRWSARELKQNKQAQLAASVRLWSLKAQSIQTETSPSESLHSLNKVPFERTFGAHLFWIKPNKD